MDNDKIITARIEDKLEQCERGSYITATGFLNMHEQSLAMRIVRGRSDVKSFFYGGYEDAERTLALFLPDYANEKDIPISVIRIKASKGGRKLTHRDYLGSLTGLGLKREMVGDILVTETGADIIVMDDVKDFILMNYNQAGKATLTSEILPISQLYIPEAKTQFIKDTVASLRLDNLISSAFQMSRSKAAEAIRSGIVFINNIQTEKTNAKVKYAPKALLMRSIIFRLLSL